MLPFGQGLEGISSDLVFHGHKQVHDQVYQKPALPFHCTHINSLHLTTMCLRYPPTIIACVCIQLACKWSNYKIPKSSEGKQWFTYIDPKVSLELLEKLTEEFWFIFDKCPSRLKKKIMASTKAVSLPATDVRVFNPSYIN